MILWQILLAGILTMLSALIITGIFIEGIYERKKIWEKLKDTFRRLWIAGYIRRRKLIQLISAIVWDIKRDIEIFWHEKG